MLVAVAGAVAGLALLRAAMYHPASPVGSPVRRVPPARGVALTFDDGPDPAWTPRVLDALERTGARASFFVLGERAERHPGVVRACAAAGHRVEVHGWRHRAATWQRPREVAAELARCVELVASLTGRRPRWYRPPYGARPWGTRCLRDRGLRLVTWSWWCRDWAGGADGGEPISDARAGDVVLLHDGPTASPAARARTLAAVAQLAASGVALGPLDDPA